MATQAMPRNGTLTADVDHVRLPGVHRAKAGSIYDRALMVSLYSEGKSTAELATYFGVKTPAITRALNECGIRLRRQTGQRDFQLSGLVSEGHSVAAASQIMGISQQRASQIWQRIVRGLGWQAQ